MKSYSVTIQKKAILNSNFLFQGNGGKFCQITGSSKHLILTVSDSPVNNS